VINPPFDTFPHYDKHNLRIKDSNGYCIYTSGLLRDQKLQRCEAYVYQEMEEEHERSVQLDSFHRLLVITRAKPWIWNKNQLMVEAAILMVKGSDDPVRSSSTPSHPYVPVPEMMKEPRAELDANLPLGIRGSSK